MKYEILIYIGYAGGIVSVLVNIYLFIKLNIKKTFMDLTGLTVRKEMKAIMSGEGNAGKTAAYGKKQSRQNRNDTVLLVKDLAKGQASYVDGHDTQILNPNKREETVEDKTTILEDMEFEAGKTTVLGDMASEADKTTVLGDMASEAGKTTVLGDMATEADKTTVLKNMASEAEETTILIGNMMPKSKETTVLIEDMTSADKGIQNDFVLLKNVTVVHTQESITGK